MPKLKDPNVWFQNALKVTENPAASGWLKNALVEAINRDPVDAAGDAEVLCRILKLRAAAVQKGPERSGALGCSSQHDLARSLGASCDEHGALQVNAHQETTVSRLYAAGDVVRGLNQVVVAAAESAIGATGIHNKLRGR